YSTRHLFCCSCRISVRKRRTAHSASKRVALARAAGSGALQTEAIAMRYTIRTIVLFFGLTGVTAYADEPKPVKDGPPLPETKPLTMQGDIAMQLVEGVDKFLLREIDKSIERRARHWKRDFSSPEAYNKSIEPNRKRLAHILGIRDPRVPFDAPELVA